MKFLKVNINTAAPRDPEASILLIYTGGTIGMVSDKQDEHLVPFDFSEVIHRVPEMRQFKVMLTVLSLDPPIDSSNIGVEHWVKLAQVIQVNYQEYDGFVILHGTDTMAYSASALSFLLENLGKPVIFTGAQVPIGRMRTDARRNLITALEIASAHRMGKPLVPEVCIFFNTLLLRGNRSTKVESRHFNAFHSGKYAPLAKAGIDIEYNQTVILDPPAGPLRVYGELESQVAVLKLFPGINEAVVKAILNAKGLKGLVLETFGAGNAPTYPWFLKLLRDAVKRGLTILNVSQCEEGEVNQGQYETSKYLKDMGVIGGSDLSTEAAVTKLMFVLAQNLSKEEIAEALQNDLRGELTNRNLLEKR
ncbi:1-alkyl-2-acetylglycerophosphocholine esterase [Rufibacter radiotolerans]|uniref:asparaginase n=1 Tax=Rufibacter radiotolerans TaxID=1379910 RepID=A0A0H4VPS1_9BACT|nr:type I asparaginase [Rufibacter radiotolerans]AKQ45719.1 1-alkyl-2-acetylglycerophosphocholine esterase [Rufibacter radiotolerans]